MANPRMFLVLKLLLLLPLPRFELAVRVLLGMQGNAGLSVAFEIEAVVVVAELLRGVDHVGGGLVGAEGR
jgi:hypothetical protein